MPAGVFVGPANRQANSLVPECAQLAEGGSHLAELIVADDGGLGLGVA